MPCPLGYEGETTVDRVGIEPTSLACVVRGLVSSFTTGTSGQAIRRPNLLGEAVPVSTRVSFTSSQDARGYHSDDSVHTLVGARLVAC